MALRDLLRARLGLRIYLVGLAQMAVIAAGFFAILHANRPHPPERFEGGVRHIARGVARVVGDRAALRHELRQIREDVGVTVTVIDPAGAVLATGAAAGAPRCADLRGEARGPGRPHCASVPLTFPDGRVGQLDITAGGPPPPPALGARVIPLVLLVVGVSSLLLARSLTRPLRRMSRAARAFGGGDLAARVGVDREDELGEVARAFDEMAERVTALLRAEKELLANVSHELRTPLARIRVALDIAAEGDAEVARESLADIRGDLEELERLISDVLTAARLDLGDGSSPAGIPPLRRERLDVGELLEQAASRFRAAHPERELRVEVAGEVPEVDGDPVLLRRVVDNLLENAHRYSDRADAEITLAGRAGGGGGEGEGDAGSSVEIEVVDEGVGIAAEDLPRVFRPFFRADRSRTRATGGLGLGLALAKRIVDAHGGSIELVSAVGEGTRARVRLPGVRG